MIDRRQPLPPAPAPAIIAPPVTLSLAFPFLPGPLADLGHLVDLVAPLLAHRFAMCLVQLGLAALDLPPRSVSPGWWGRVLGSFDRRV